MRSSGNTRRSGSQDDTSAEEIPLSSPGRTNPSRRKAPPSRPWRVYCNIWKWEIAACVLSLISVVAMVVTLLTHAGKSTPQWPFAITLNALLSIFATILRAALMFTVSSCIMQLQWTWFTAPRPLYDVVHYDGAGRGAWGSLIWLWAHHIREPLTALGAIITILAIAIDPFVQQLVRPVGCGVVLSGSNATLSRTNLFDYSSLQKQLETFTVDLQDAVSVGALAPTNGTVAGCSTGNCTFAQTFGTLGWCSSCVDASTQLSFDLTCAPYNERNDTIGTGRPIKDSSQCGNEDKDVFAVVQSSLPTGLNTTYANSLYSSYEQAPDVDRLLYSMRSIAGLDNPDCATSPSSSCYRDLTMQVLAGKVLLYETDDATDVAKTSTMVFNAGINPITQQETTGCNGPNQENDWQCRGYGAANCTLQPCVREYSVSVENDQVLQLSAAGSAIIPLPVVDDGTGPDLVGLVDTSCITDSERSVLAKEGFVAANSDRWLPYSINMTDQSGSAVLKSDSYIFSGSGNASLLQSLLERQCLYLVDVPSMRTLLDTLWFIFDAELVAVGYDYSSYIDNSQVSVFRIARVDGPDFLQHMYNNGNMSFERVRSTMDNISEVLTQRMRVSGNLNYSEPAVGQVLHYDTCSEIRWPWLAFPATLAGLGLAFLIMVITCTAEKRVPVWKSSPLVWIFHGPRADDCSLESEEEQPGEQPVVTTADVTHEKSKLVLATLVNGKVPQLKLVDF